MILGGMFQEVANALAQLILPPRCAACDELIPSPQALMACGKREHHFCALCETSFEPILQACQRCGSPLSGEVAQHVTTGTTSTEPTEKRQCDDCRRNPPPFSQARAPYCYGGQLAVAIHRFKYQHKTHVLRALAALVRGTLGQWNPRVDVVLPVPLFRDRLRQRGFNHAALLARVVAAQLDKPLCYDLTRIRATTRQADLPRTKRWGNVAGAFVARPKRIQDRRVLLVDDVMTTGATLEACGLPLLELQDTRISMVTIGMASI